MSYYAINKQDGWYVSKEAPPIKPEFKGDVFLHYGPQKQYEQAEATYNSSFLPLHPDSVDEVEALILSAINPAWIDEDEESSSIEQNHIYGPLDGELENGRTCYHYPNRFIVSNHGSRCLHGHKMRCECSTVLRLKPRL